MYQPPRLHQLDPNRVRRSIADRLQAGDTTGFTSVGRDEHVQFLKQNSTGRVFANVLQEAAKEAVVDEIKRWTGLGDVVDVIVTDDNPLYKTAKETLAGVTQLVTDGKVKDERFERSMHGMTDSTGPHERDAPHLPFQEEEDDDGFRYDHEVTRANLRFQGASRPDLARPTEEMHQAALRIDDAFNYNKPRYDMQGKPFDGAQTREAAIERASRLMGATIDESISTSAGVVHVEADGRITVSLRGRDGSNPNTWLADTLNSADVLAGREPRKTDAALQMIEAAFEKYGRIDTLNGYSMGGAITESLARAYPALMARIDTIHLLNPLLGPRDTFKHTITRPNTKLTTVEGDFASGPSLAVHLAKGTIDPTKLTVVAQRGGYLTGHSHEHLLHSDEHGNSLPRSVSEVEKALQKMSEAVVAHKANPTAATRAAGVQALQRVRALTQQHQVLIEQLSAFDQSLHGPRVHSPEAVALMEQNWHIDPAFEAMAELEGDARAIRNTLREVEARGVTVPAGTPADRRTIAPTPAHLKPLTFAQEAKKGALGMATQKLASEALGGLHLGTNQELTAEASLQALAEGAYRGKVAAGGVRAALLSAGGRSIAAMAIGAELGPAIAATYAGFYTYEAVASRFEGYEYQEELAGMYSGMAAGGTAAIAADLTTLAVGVSTAAWKGAEMGAAVSSVLGPEAWAVGALIGMAIGVGFAVAVDALTEEEEFADSEFAKDFAAAEAKMLMRFLGGDDARMRSVEDLEAKARGIKQKHAENSVVRTMLEHDLIKRSEDPNNDGPHKGARTPEVLTVPRDTHAVKSGGPKRATRGPNTNPYDHKPHRKPRP